MEASGVELGAALVRLHPLGRGEAGPVPGQDAPEAHGAPRRDGPWRLAGAHQPHPEAAGPARQPEALVGGHRLHGQGPPVDGSPHQPGTGAAWRRHGPPVGSHQARAQLGRWSRPGFGVGQEEHSGSHSGDGGGAGRGRARMVFRPAAYPSEDPGHPYRRDQSRQCQPPLHQCRRQIGADRTGKDVVGRPEG